MRGLLIAVIAAAAIWSGYWFVGKNTLEHQIETVLAEAPAKGIEITQQSYKIAGFPNRFDVTVTAPKVQDLRNGNSWQAPFFQLFALSYKPWHLIAAFPDTQSLTLWGQEIEISSSKMQASVVVAPNTDLTLDRSTLVADSLRLSHAGQKEITAETFRFATRRDPSRDHAHVIGLEMQQITPQPALAQLLPELPAQIETLHSDATLITTASLDRHAVQTRPQIAQIELREARLNWGELGLFAKGNLGVVAGYPEGKLDLRVTGWRHLMPLLTGLGLIPAQNAPMIERMAAMLAAGSSDKQSLELPLVFAKGQMSLGPIPLGPAPRIAD